MAPKRKNSKKGRKARSDSPPPPLRVCHSNAKLRYGLTDRDLFPLDYDEVENPHYSSAAPMKLYLIAEVEEAAKQKKERLAYETEHAEEIAAEKAQAAKERRAVAAEAAKERRAAAAEAAKGAVQSFAGKCKAARYGGVSLPDVVLDRIMVSLADSLEPGGLRGPDRVVRDLAAAAAVCWYFYHASKAGFRALADACSSRLRQAKQQRVNYYPSYTTSPKSKAKKEGPADLLVLPGSLGWAFWDQVVGQPLQLKVEQLKAGAKLLGVQVTGTKAELVLRLLSAFNLTAPAPGAPAQLLKAVLHERSTNQPDFIFVDGPDRCSSLFSYIGALRSAGHQSASEAYTAVSSSGKGGLAAARAALVAGGFNTLSDLFNAATIAHEAAMETRRQRVAAEAAAFAQRQAAAAELFAQREAAAAEFVAQRQQRAQQRLASYAAAAAAGVVAGVPGRCICGNLPSPTCVRHCCQYCCRRVAEGQGPQAAACPRHG